MYAVTVRRIAKEVGKVAGLFVILGIGLGLAGYVGLDQFVPEPSGENDFGAAFIGALLMFQAIFFMYFIGPAMAVVTGIYTGRHSNERNNSAIAGGAGAFVGFYVMFIIAFLIMSLAFPETGGGDGGGGGGTSLGDTINQMIIMGIPTGLVGAITGYLTFGQSEKSE